MRATPRTPPTHYREAIGRPATGERKYIRYYDGRGHFGHVALQLVPRAGEFCTVTADASCHLPEDGCVAVRSALYRRLERGPVRHLPLIGVEARLIGGSWLPRHSYPEACANAACMAFDEALLRADPYLVEPYIGVRLLVEPSALSRTITTLASLLGEVHATHSVTDIIRLEAEIPARLAPVVRRTLQLHALETFPLAKDAEYRPVRTTGHAPESDTLSDDLDEWT